MKTGQRLISAGLLFILLSAFAAGAALAGPTTPALDDPAQAPPDPVAALQSAHPDWLVSTHAATGRLRMLQAAGRQPLLAASLEQAALPAEVAARSFLSSYAAAFGLGDAQAGLALLSSETLAAQPGDRMRSFVRFQQTFNGIPVMGAVLVVQLDANNNVLSANGETAPDLQINTTPRISLQAARQAALQLAAKVYQLPVESLQASQPVLQIYNPALLNSAAPLENQLTYQVVVTSPAHPQIRHLVLVETVRGSVALDFNQVHAAMNRIVYDNNNSVYATLPGATPPVRTEGSPVSAVADANNAYDLAGLTYDFYYDNHARDSIDNKGMPIVSTVRFTPDGAAFENAFWNGAQMVYGAGYASADDVVGHELTHGVTEYESGLYYYMQSGAINEALSDIWGEFIDQTYNTAIDNDDVSVRWLMGEDLSIGAIRNMSNPPLYSDPDKMTSALYYCGDADSGGVHINSGVANKAAFLMVDGETFNSITVTGIGINKTARIWYEAQTNLLTPASDYQDLGDALQLACNNLVGDYGITPVDCSQVSLAVLATQMNSLPSTLGCAQADAPICTSGEPLLLFNENFENIVSGNWIRGYYAGYNGDGMHWYLPNSANPYGLDERFGSGAYNLLGDDFFDTSDSYIRMSRDVALPAGANVFLRFEHAYDFEANYDGGILEYSNNGGSTWSNATALFTHNGYNGTISNSYGNPLGGQSAFINDSQGATASRLNLNTLSGSNVRFRFRIGTDLTTWDRGWWIDNFQIFSCVTNTREVFLPLAVRSGALASNFHSDFNGSLGDWVVHNGAWTAAPTSLSVPGITNQRVSISYPLNYSNVVIEARMKRDGAYLNSNAIVVRGTPDPLNSSKDWYSGYIFQYVNDGQYSIFRANGGVYTALLSWTNTNTSVVVSDIYGDYYNVMKVIAIGTNLYFYINDVLLWSGSDATLTNGRVGISSYSNSAYWNPFYVDWVTVTPIDVTSMPEQELFGETLP